MAINQTNVALDIASRAVAATDRLLDALAVLEELYQHGSQAGLNMINYDANFAASAELQHVDGATLNKVLAVVASGIRSTLTTQQSGGQTWEAILYKARR